MSKSSEIIKRDKKVISPSLTRDTDFVFKYGKGCCVFDADNKKYIDFSAGIAVNSLGYGNKDILNAIKKQLNYGMHIGFGDFYAEKPVEFVETLLKFVPKHLNKAFLSNSGTETVEAAYKLARWHTRKKWVIAFKNSFHGRTYASLSMTNTKKVQRDRYDPFLPVKHVPYADTFRFKGSEKDCINYCLNELEKTISNLKKDVAAVFMEPIQGEGGYIVPPKDFVKGVREICDNLNVLLAVDEVQSGCYRTGKFLAMENFNVKPDIVCLSKAIGGGLPLGVTLANDKIMNWVPGSHNNTFGGNLAACSSAIAFLNCCKKKKIWNNVNKVGSYMMKRLNKLKEEHEIIGDVRGLGLMIGVDFVNNKKDKSYNFKTRDKIVLKCKENGLIVLPAGKSVIRFCPPLILNKKEADAGLRIFEKSLKKVNK
ncbi:aminotransferase class III-fold pyridoxal phosphate-dependent enzyme [Candidatus Woesearchaeota archaeon]|nr:aminotransferase class III-fold pyridoxal phosphate-dependent enzyme [Candidatus Woesearchaeota archaeon]